MSGWRTGLWMGIWCCGVAQASNFPAINFYRTPQSLFSSGQATRAELEKDKKTELTQNFFQVRKDHREFRLAAEAVVRDLDVAWRVIEKTTGQKGTLQKTAAPWYQFQSSAGVLSWKLAEQLTPLPDDLGLAFVFAPHAWRKRPDWKSESLADLSFGQRFRVLGFSGEFVHVAALDHPSQTGYLELSHVILKIDFASFIMEEGGPWRSFSYRSDQSAVLTDKKKAPLARVARMITRPELGIVNQTSPEFKLSPRSIVEVFHGEWVQWAESELKGHGRVYWKKQEQSTESQKSNELIGTDQILKKKFYSVALHPKNPVVALVSAQGIFSTQDGKNWSKIAAFQDNNLPVAIAENGDLFVGSFRSTDHGQSFHPFIRWEDLTMLLENQQQQTLGLLTLSEIKTLASSQVEIVVGNGSRRAWLKGSARFGLVTDWKIVKTE